MSTAAEVGVADRSMDTCCRTRALPASLNLEREAVCNHVALSAWDVQRCCVKRREQLLLSRLPPAPHQAIGAHIPRAHTLCLPPNATTRPTVYPRYSPRSKPSRQQIIAPACRDPSTPQNSIPSLDAAVICRAPSTLTYSASGGGVGGMSIVWVIQFLLV